MFSSLGEYVTLLHVVPTLGPNEEAKEENSGELLPRRVEEWLQDVESQMRLSLRHQFNSSKHDGLKSARQEWLLNWPAQVV